jgi:hypothetical protein
MRKAVILGGGDTLWTDLAQIPDVKDRTVIAINDAGSAYRGRIDYWVSLHPEKLEGWRKKRKGNQDYETVCHKERKGARVDHVVRELWSGSSGLFAAQFAVLNLNCDDVVLCGVPMTPTGHFFSSDAWHHATKYRRGWKEALPEIQGRVTSLSGWTRDLLGAPAHLVSDQP